MDIFLTDGYTATRTIEAQPGFHPELVIVYRPALSKERHAIRIKIGSNDAAAIDTAETDLIARYVQTVNGVPMKDKEKLARLRPMIRSILVDLIMSLSPEDEGKSAENLCGA